MAEKTSDGLPARAYLRVLARWKWLIIGVTLVITILGTGYTWTRTPIYAAASSLLYTKQIDIANPLGQSFIDTTAQQAEIESVPTVIQSAEVQTRAQHLMGPLANGSYSVSANLQPGLNNLYSNIVAIEATSPSRVVAASAANAYAQAYIEWGRINAQQQVAQAIDVVKGQIASATPGSAELTSLRQSLQQLELLQASVSGNFQVITKATPPSTPVSPRKKRGLALALVGGLVIGIGLAFVLEQFDTRLRSDEQISGLLDLPIIGHIPRLSQKTRDNGVLPTLTDPSGPGAEAYRLLRSNLEFVSLDGEMRTLLVLSSVQGEGKSVAACNLAVSMALGGKRVALVDADLRGPRVHAYVGVPNAVGVSSVIARRVELSAALVPVVLDATPRLDGGMVMTAKVGAAVPAGAERPRPAEAPGQVMTHGDFLWPGASGEAPVLQVLPSGPLPPNPGEMVASRRFGEIIADLSEAADIVLIDAPAMLRVGDAAALAHWAGAVVYIVNPEQVRRRDLEQARSQLEHLPCRKLGIIEVVDRKSQGYYGGYYSDGSRKSSGKRA